MKFLSWMFLNKNFFKHSNCRNERITGAIIITHDSASSALSALLSSDQMAVASFSLVRIL